MASAPCRHCGLPIYSETPARCPYCWAVFCPAFLRPCEASHIDHSHPRARKYREPLVRIDQ